MKNISFSRNMLGLFFGLSAGAALTGAPFVCAAPAAKKPARKSAKTVAKPRLIREVLGTEQLQGYEGVLGQTFTVGKSSPINFTLKKVEYSANRVNIGTYSHLPKGDEKMLVLHFTVQNPQKTAMTYISGFLLFKAVDASGVTRDFVGETAREVTGEAINFQLQPGQKVEGYTAVRVSAFGEVPKLIVQSYYERQGPIVRYDLRGKAGKLGAPYADPADKKGATLRKMVPAKVGTFYPVTDLFDVCIDKVSYSTDALASREPGTGKRYVIANATLKNRAPRAVRYSQSYFRADLKDADGEKTDYNTSILKGSRDEEAGAELLPGEEARIRFYWVLPDNVEAKTVLLQYGYDRESRTFAVDVAGAK
ncbi:MAG TPA: hypothetical protein VF600_07305 [Abditibacteriaceae bacterium]|jgi:hypothetical protein